MDKKLFDYDPDDPLSIINRSIFCPVHKRFSAFLSCPACPDFPCRVLSRTDLRMLSISPFLSRIVTELKPRRQKMYILKKYDGTLEIVQELDEKNPDQELLKEVEEVYPVTKVLVPQLRLVPKTKEERSQIKESLEAKKAAPKETPDEAADSPGGKKPSARKS
ncbi:MAG: hypothetical protein K9K64_04295 [Desulfohalobiaceae bacterium]|nr:hypothetical protein [Desulfohalobiaceae bacterium]